MAKVKVIKPDESQCLIYLSDQKETEEDLLESFEELRKADVDLLTLGQYLSPGSRYHPAGTLHRTWRTRNLDRLLPINPRGSPRQRAAAAPAQPHAFGRQDHRPHAQLSGL